MVLSLTPGIPSVQHVTIQPRGGALGRIVFQPMVPFPSAVSPIAICAHIIDARYRQQSCSSKYGDDAVVALVDLLLLLSALSGLYPAAMLLCSCALHRSAGGGSLWLSSPGRLTMQESPSSLLPGIRLLTQCGRHTAARVPRKFTKTLTPGG